MTDITIYNTAARNCAAVRLNGKPMFPYMPAIMNDTSCSILLLIRDIKIYFIKITLWK